MEKTDEDLMLAFGRGDQEAFAQLYARFKGPVFRYFRRSIADCQHADDCFQETWRVVIDSSAQYRVDAPFKHWLFRIAHTKAIDHFRRQVRNKKHDDADLDDMASANDSPETRQIKSQEDDCILRAIQSLNPHQKDAFLLQYEGGFSLEKIAEIVDSNKEAIKSRLRYARNAMQVFLQGCL